MDHNKINKLSDINSVKKSAPLVSILIPSFNHEKYIAECLESVKSSDYQNLELILLDDGSSDRTYEIAKDWILANKDRFVKASCSQQANTGICNTLNCLVSSSRGEYISVLASDDQLLPQGISQQVSCALKSNADLLLSDAELIDENGILIASSAFRFFGKNVTRLKNRSLLHLDILLNWNPPYQHHFIKKALFEKLGPYDTSYVIEDFDFCLRALVHANLGLCPHSTWRYRIRLSNRVSPGLDREEILSNVCSIRQNYLYNATGLDRIVLGALISSAGDNGGSSIFWARILLELVRLFLKVVFWRPSNKRQWIFRSSKISDKQ
ncbi:MAG: glycosyltransferase [Xanthomonadales bacterium]|nr:glycosyltransferase [Xanthomonadales bacterium]